MPLPAVLAGGALAGGMSLGQAGLLTLGSGILNAGQSYLQQGWSLDQAKKMSDYQYGKDLDMWNRNNAYNSPMEQMARLKAAGLNPNLVYGSGGVSGNTIPASMPKYQAPGVRYDAPPIFDLPSMISSYQDFKVKQAQIDNMRAQKDAIDQGVANAKLQGLILGARLPREQMETRLRGETIEERIATELLGLQTKGQMLPFQLTMAEEGVNRIRTANSLGLEQIFSVRKGREKTDEEIRYNKLLQRKVLADTANVQARTGMIPFEKNRLIQQIQTGYSQQGYIDAQTQLKQKEIEYFLTNMYGNLIIRGLGAVGGAVRSIRDWRGNSLPGGGSKGVDPTNKAFQRGLETRQQWMQRVNPQAIP